MSCTNKFNMKRHLNMNADKDQDVESLTKRNKQIDGASHNHCVNLEHDTDIAEASHIETSYKIEEEKSFPVSSMDVVHVSSFSGCIDYNMQISDVLNSYNDNNLIIQCTKCKQLIKELAPSKVSNKDTVKKLLDKKFDAMTQALKQKLSETSYVTLTTTLKSKSLSMIPSYIVMIIKVYFLNRNTKLESGVIEIIELPFDFSEKHIVNIFLNTLLNWNINIDKVVMMVTNYDPKLIRAVISTFGVDRHLLCIVHTLNLVAENTMENCEGFADFVDEVRTTVRSINDNIDATSKLRQLQIDRGVPKSETKELILDVKGKWITTFDMIKRFVEMSDMINILFMENNASRITVNKLITLKEIMFLLKFLVNLIRECVAEKYVMLSKMIPFIAYIKDTLESNSIMLRTELSARLKRTIISEISWRFNIILFMDIFNIATILDPRFKILHFHTLSKRTYNLRLMNKYIKLLFKLRDKLSNESTSSDVSDVNFEKWLYYMVHSPTNKTHKVLSLDKELFLYLTSPLDAMEDDPLEKWESMKRLYPSLYRVAIKYLTIVVMTFDAKKMFPKPTNQYQPSSDRPHELVYVNSNTQKYYFQ